MGTIFLSFAYLSLIAVVSSDICVGSRFISGIGSLIEHKWDVRNSLMKNIHLLTYHSLGSRRSLPENCKKKYGKNSSFIDTSDGYIEKREKYLSFSENSKIDLVSALIHDNLLLKDLLIKLMKLLYSEEQSYLNMGCCRVDCISDLVEELSCELKKLVILSSSENFVPNAMGIDSMWLSSVKLPSKDLDDLYQGMLRATSDDNEIPRTLFYYVKFNNDKSTRLNVLYMSDIMLMTTFGEDVARAIIKRKAEEISNVLNSDALLSEFDLLISSKKMKEIVLEECSKHSFSFEKIKSILSFNKIGRNIFEWVIPTCGHANNRVRIFKI